MQAIAQDSPCATNPHDSACPLDAATSLLRVLAIVLTIFLILAVVIAVAVYRRNKRFQLTPHD